MLCEAFVKSHGLKMREGGEGRCCSAPSPARIVLILLRFLLELFLPPSRPGLVTVIAKFFFAPLPKRVHRNACVRRMRLWDSSHALEPGDMYTAIVFVYTTASDFSNPARGPTVFTGVAGNLLLHRPLIEKGQ